MRSGRNSVACLEVRAVYALRMTPPLKIVVERHSDGYVAYPLGLARGVVVGEGASYEAALDDVRSAIAFHLESFGPDALSTVEDDPVLEAFVAEAALPA